ncbi:MAG: glycosyltransferase [Bdellovibrionales bacterium]|nr:glycosyltransferase [Bdellovibrionales bacterium]
MAFTLLALGVLGLLGSTTLFPLLAPILHWRLSRVLPNPDSKRNQRENGARKLTIAIPTCGEVEALERTLQSISYAIAYAHKHLTVHEISIELLVGIDGSAPKALLRAHQFQARVLSSDKRAGKWRMLERMTRHIEGRSSAFSSSWVIFADVGVEWPKDFLLSVLSDMKDPHVVGIAPAYTIRDSSLIQRSVWSIERSLKTLENFSGGPVSVHGATVGYRIDALIRVFDFCVGKEYANDDVVLPLLIRTLNPSKVIQYRGDVAVIDTESTEVGSDERRRTRMLIGNTKWVQDLYPFVLRTNPLVALIALRRVFRILWAYWIGSVFLGGGITLVALSWSVFIELSGVERLAVTIASGGAVCTLAIVLALVCEQLISAAKVSLLGPWYWGKSNSSIGKIWK